MKRPSQTTETKSSRAYPAREGKKALNVFLSYDLHYTLSRLALDENTSLQALAEEAWMDLLEKRGVRLKRAPAAMSAPAG